MHWNADPIMLMLGPVSIRWYGFFFTLGLVIVILHGHRVFKQRGLPEKDASNLAIILPIALFAGAHLGYHLFYDFRSVIENPLRLLDFRAGLASHGGAIGVVVATLLFVRGKKASFFAYADAIIVVAVWLIPTIRMGNFFNSEIVGRPTDLPWGIVFDRAGLTEPRHPVQLYEALMGVGLVLLAAWFHRRRELVREGATFFTVLAIYFVLRFSLEYTKEYQVVAPTFPFTMGQMLSLPMAIVCIAFVWRLRPVFVSRPMPRA